MSTRRPTWMSSQECGRHAVRTEVGVQAGRGGDRLGWGGQRARFPLSAQLGLSWSLKSPSDAPDLILRRNIFVKFSLKNNKFCEGRDQILKERLAVEESELLMQAAAAGPPEVVRRGQPGGAAPRGPGASHTSTPVRLSGLVIAP